MKIINWYTCKKFQILLGQLHSKMQKKELRPYQTQYAKIKSEWIKDKNLRAETINILKKSIGVNICVLEFDKKII